MDRKGMERGATMEGGREGGWKEQTEGEEDY